MAWGFIELMKEYPGFFRESWNRKGWRKVSIVLPVLSFALLGLNFYLMLMWLPAVSQGICWLTRWTAASTLHRLIAFPVVIGCAASLISGRYKVRYLYGLYEMAFALDLIWYVLSTSFPSAALSGVAMISAIYVLARGYDNYRQGTEEKKKYIAELERKRTEEQPAAPT